ncbi:MAG TPA: hypothetical protein PLB92_05880 [Rhodoglobus sp.]|nr:hypothetical protein [Rhodoglobus sp.]
MTKDINTLKVGDTVVEIWGTRLTNPAVITAIDTINFGGKPLRTGVRFAGGWWPARSNDTRKVVTL